MQSIFAQLTVQIKQLEVKHKHMHSFFCIFLLLLLLFFMDISENNKTCS